MDNLTHALLGASLIGLRVVPPQHRRGVWLAVMLGSQAPDFDLLPSLFSAQAQVAWHRGYSHSLLGMAVIAGLVTLTVGILEPRLPRSQILMWVMVAVMLHCGVDTLTSYGTKVFYPLQAGTVALDILYGLDLVILGILSIGAVLDYRGQRYALTVALCCVIIYVVGRGALHKVMVTAVAKQYSVSKFSVLPDLNPLGAWTVIIDTGEAYQVGQINPVGSKLIVKANYSKNLAQPLVQSIRNDPTIDSYLAVARYPIAEISSKGSKWEIRLTDLRLWPHLSFNAVASLNGDLKLEKVKIGP